MHFAFGFFLFASSWQPDRTVKTSEVVRTVKQSRIPRTRAFSTISRTDTEVDLSVETSSVETQHVETEVKLTWEPDLAAEILQKLSDPAEEVDIPYMIAVVGIPGSGKSTSSAILNDLLSSEGSMLMPFDGYHYPISELEKFPDADDAIYRRGASDTFDVQSLKKDLRSIRYGESKNVKVPGFDHAMGDPEPGAHIFERDQHRVVVVEGLYLLHDEGGWEEVKNLFDYTIFVDADVDICVERLKLRNTCIPGYTPEEIFIRCDKVDRINAMAVERSKKRADLVVKSAASMQRVDTLQEADHVIAQVEEIHGQTATIELTASNETLCLV